MKTHALAILVGSAVSFALPALGQQQDTPEPQTVARLDELSEKYDQADNKADASAMAALFTDDAVFVTDRGPIKGRQAIKKWFADLYQAFPSCTHNSKPDQDASHMIGTSGDRAWTAGGWSLALQAKSGDPIPLKGYWSAIEVRDGNDWKFQMLAWNMTPALPPETK
jgi:ketosteroid isomerase-like protein